ncbi:MAG: ABC transporter ATP-binding protein [Rhodoferax sp.]|nr:ABC transporter ATP-binding protein [Rhodoferax sp.]MCF8212237.1 ABC transporter ATP-binding protein [Rhodoferax sp.]
MIRVAQLGKAFKRYARIRHRLLEWLPGSRVHHELRWVLTDLNFTVAAGEAIGLIGRNGAGKSTLLKLLTGTLVPTTGNIEVTGRVAALLELGMGFHPEFSGFDNVLMAAQLQGLSRAEVLACMDDIVAFAEIGDALHQPVREYSSGMMVRLAFATATAVRPDLLIVDEALAVGDAYFQHKCFRRIREFREQGVTLLFVSHDPLAVKSLCDRALLIEGGRIAMDGPPLQVLDYYNALLALDQQALPDHPQHIQAQASTLGVRSGTGSVKIDTVRLLRQGQETTQAIEGEAVTLALHLSVYQAVPDLTIGLLLRDRLGNEVFGTNTHQLGLSEKLQTLTAGQQVSLHFSLVNLPLGPGSYSITVAAHGADSHLEANYDWWDQALTFEVGFGSGSRFSGLVRLPVVVSIDTTPI